MMTLSPLARRVTYVLIFEVLAITFATLLLAALSGGHAHGSLPVAAASSLAAVIWNFLYNTGFEAWERRNGVIQRKIVHRLAHAIGFEIGLIGLLIPLYMWWYQIGAFEALRMEVALLLFFLAFTFVFTWSFDRLVPKAPEGACPAT